MQVTMIRVLSTRTNIRPATTADHVALKEAGAFTSNPAAIRREADWAEFARRSGLGMTLKVTDGIRLVIN